MILRNVSLAKSGIRTMNFRRVKFRLLKGLLEKISSEAVLRVEQSWLLFGDAFLRAQMISIPQNKKTGREGRKLLLLGKDRLVTLSEKKGMSLETRVYHLGRIHGWYLDMQRWD